MRYISIWILACLIIGQIQAESGLVHQYYEDKGGKVHVLKPKTEESEQFEGMLNSVLSKISN